MNLKAIGNAHESNHQNVFRSYNLNTNVVRRWVNTWSAVRLRDISSIILNDVIWSMKINKIVDNAWNYKGPGGRLNKKDGLTRYGDSHVKDKTS